MNETVGNDLWSRRAQILAKVLDWVNQGRYEDHDSWMLFGGMGTDVGGEMKVLYEKSDADEETIHQTAGDLQVHAGKLFDAKRTSLEVRAPKLKVRGMEDLSHWQPEPGWRARPEPERSEVAECLDAKYSLELIGKLENIVRRAALLDPHEADTRQIHDDGVRAQFQEAHRCYLYGFNAACAILCRAILESALKAKVDPDHKIEYSLLRGQSYFKKLIELSRLVDPLPSHAEEVKRSGDNAVHDYQKFQKECESQGKMEDILGWTRAVLAALYEDSSIRS